MDENTVRSKIIRICHLIHSKGLVSGSGGNVSFRIGDGVVITPSGGAFEFLEENDLVRIDMDGHPSGLVPPSKETSLHLNCYKARGDVRAVIHVHSVYSVALSCLTDRESGNCVPVYTPGYGIRVGSLPVLPYMLPGSPLLAAETARVISGRNSVLLENHGLVTVGASLEEALSLTEEIEENAEIHFILAGRGKALNAEQLEGLKDYHS